MYEVAEDGRQVYWGEGLADEPGRRFAMTWQLGRSRDSAGEVEVLFEPTGEGCFRLTLTHSSWDCHGGDAEQMRNGYDMGWNMVSGERFADYARDA